jgi:type II secretory pathway pseudopilin PulG
MHVPAATERARQAAGSTRRGARHKGLTIVELLVIVTIIAMMVALLLPTLTSARESARRTQCANNLKQVTMALLNITSSSGIFPAGTTLLNVTPTTANTTWCVGGDTNGYTPWTVAALPFLEQQELYDNLTIGLIPEGRFMDDTFVVPLPNGAAENLRPLSVLQCPASQITSRLRNNYFGVQGSGAAAACADTDTGKRWFFINGVLYANSRTNFANIRDGASHVFLLGETRWCSHLTAQGEQFNWLLSGKSGSGAIPVQVAGVEQKINADVSSTGSRLLEWATRGFGSDHYGGCHFGTCDGSVQFVKESADLQVLRNLAGRNDGGLIQDVLP